MPHLIQLKDGSLLTSFDIRDLLDAVEQCAGRELRQEIESYINLNVEDIDDYEKAKGALIGISKSTMGFEGLCRSDNLEALSGLDIATEIPSLSQISVGLMKEHTTLAGLF